MSWIAKSDGQRTWHTEQHQMRDRQSKNPTWSSPHETHVGVACRRSCLERLPGALQQVARRTSAWCPCPASRKGVPKIRSEVTCESKEKIWAYWLPDICLQNSRALQHTAGFKMQGLALLVCLGVDELFGGETPICGVAA